MDDKKNSMPIELLGLSARSYNSLKRSSINTVGDLIQLSTDDLMEIKNLGKTSVAEVMDVIRRCISGEFDAATDLPEETYMNITKNAQSYQKEKDIIKAGKEKVLHYIDATTVVKEVNDVLFYDGNGIVVDDVAINDILLGARAKGTLLRNGYKTAKDVVMSKYEDFKNINGMGEGTREEILNKLREITFIQFAENFNADMINKCSEILCEDIRKNCPRLKVSSYESLIKVLVYKNEDMISDADNILENKTFLEKIYSDTTLNNVFENYICTLLLAASTLPLYTLKQKMPTGLRNTDVFMQIINNLTAKGKLDYTESGLQYHLLTVLDYTKLMEEGNQKTALMCRLKGMTLEEAGNVIGVTRERVRQLTKKALQKMPKLREDDLKYWYEQYDITKEEFRNIFDLTEESYNYLKGTYKKGSRNLEELLNDENITGPIAQKALKEMYKYCILIEGEYVPLKREKLIRKLFEINYSDSDCAVSEFYNLYMDFLKTNGLDKNEKLLYPSERAFEARLDDQRYSLVKYGRRLRYYNMDEYDLDRLFAELNLSSFDGLEISTLKLFNSYPELMDEFNIQDEYELHNIMKKNEEKLVSYNVTLGRMPFLSVGKTDREQQTVEFLFRVAPIGIYDFGKAYEEEFGVKSETVLANFTTYVYKYYSNGEFLIDYTIMSDAEYKIMGNKLTEDFYFIEDIKQIYSETFPNGDLDKINPYNLKTMGFMVYVDYVVRATYGSGENYFRQLLSKDDIVDLDKFDKRIMYNQVFTYVIENLRVNCEILEFERNKYLSFRRFSKGASYITQEDLKQFAIDAAKYEDEEFFTIKSIRNKGFTSKLDDLGFDDWFYGALLRGNKEIRYSKVGGGFLFSHIGRQFKRSDFFLFLMKKFKKIDIMKFIDYIKEEYGLTFDRYDVTPIIAQSSMYYDSTMEKIYLNKEEYYEDI